MQHISSKPRSSNVRDDLAYFLPMAMFLTFVWAGGHWKNLFPHFYAARTVIVGAMLIAFWRHYTPPRWSWWWLGVIGGIVGVVQWLATQSPWGNGVVGGYGVSYPGGTLINTAGRGDPAKTQYLKAVIAGAPPDPGRGLVSRNSS